MFKTKKDLLSIIISALAVQTTQPIEWGWLTNNSIYKQGTELCSRLSKKVDTYKKYSPYGNWLLKKANEHTAVIIGSAVAAIGLTCMFTRIRNYEHMQQQKRQEEEEISGQRQDALDDELDKDLSNKLTNISCTDDDESLEKHWSCVRGLILCGANPNATNYVGEALHCAAECENRPMVRFLQRHHAKHLDIDSQKLLMYST